MLKINYTILCICIIGIFSGAWLGGDAGAALTACVFGLITHYGQRIVDLLESGPSESSFGLGMKKVEKKEVKSDGLNE